MGSVATLTRLTNRVLPGPSPSFSTPHLVLVFLTIANSSYVSRAALAKRSNLGEGAIRTILKKLRDEGYVASIRSGCYATPSGKALTRSLGSSMTLIDFGPSNLSMGSQQAALALRGAGARVRTGIEQRDSAIKIGASGATTYVIRSGKFTIPGGSADCERDFPSDAWPALKRGLRPRNGDAVILCGAVDEVSARLGALAAALTLA